MDIGSKFSPWNRNPYCIWCHVGCLEFLSILEGMKVNCLLAQNNIHEVEGCPRIELSRKYLGN